MSKIAPHRPLARPALPLALLACLLSLPFLPDGFFGHTAHAAASFNVNSTGDAADSNTADNVCDDGAGNCTLRAAIQQANATPGADSVTFSVNGTINLTGALPDINGDLTVNGPGPAQLAVRRDTGGEYRILNIGGGVVVSVSGLRLENGRTATGAVGTVGAPGLHGGGVYNGGTLTLTDVTLEGNGTGFGGQGTSVGGKGGNGGGVYNGGTLTMTNCNVVSNSTGFGGIGPDAAGDGGNGGGVYNVGAATITNCVFTFNTTGATGSTSAGGGGASGGRGGAIYSEGALTVTGTRLHRNGTGGGHCTGTGSTAGPGAGLYVAGGAASLTDSTVSDNLTLTNCAGINGAAGGIYNLGALTVLRSTLSGNTGALGAAVINQGTLSLTNSTVSGNRSPFAGDGAVFNESTMKLTNSTVTANEVRGVVSAGNASITGNTIVGNTIIAANGSLGDVLGNFNSLGHNYVGRGDNSTGFANGVNGDHVGSLFRPANPQLGPLADNGGPTLTHAPLVNSLVIDNGDNALALDASNNPLTTDQRGAGFPRVADSADMDEVQTVDIGAYETHPHLQLNSIGAFEDTPSTFNFFVVGDVAHGISSVTAVSDNQALVPDANIQLSTTGQLRTITVSPVANRSGVANITLTATATNGRTFSATTSVTIFPVNDAPSFTKGADQTVAEDSGAQTVAGWATGISAGPPDESGQTLSFEVTGNTNPNLFSAGPAVSPDGTLTFTPAPNANGTAAVTLVLKDDGGTAEGGQNTSAAQTFNVTVGAVNDAPVNTVPGAQTTARNTPLVFSFANSNAISVFDIDTDTAEVRLTATNGTLTLGRRTGLAFIEGDGIDDATMLFAGLHSNINAALSGLTFTPAQGFTGTASVQIITDDQGNTGSGGAKTDADTINVNVVTGGSLQLSAAAFEAGEAGATATLKVTRTGASAGAASLNFATSGGTATAGASCGSGADYVTASGTLSWADGDAADKTITVTLCDNSSHEPDETFNVTLSGATGSAALGTPSTATVTIKDDDPAGGLIEFSQAVYTTGENSFATVTVRRTGDTNLAVGVDYSTDDGSTPSVAVPCASTTGQALHRCDFTQAVGRLSFAAGEAEKTFDVLVGDDSYVEGTETAIIRLSNPGGGATLGQLAAAVLSIADDSPETSGNPNDISVKFVRQHYHDFLSREPDAPGLAHWTNVADNCGATDPLVCRINVSAAFFLAIEFQQTGYLVERAYKAAFGDATGTSTLGGTPHTLTVPVVRFEEFLPDTQRIGRGVVVLADGWEEQIEANKTAYFLEFVQRSRFTAAFPTTMTPAAFVDQLNARAGNPLDGAERTALINELTANNTTAGRASVLRKVAEDATLADAERNRAFVLMQYFGYLRRNPDDAPDSDYTGYDFWLGNLEKFNGNFVQAELVKAFILSAEYRKRFGQ